LNSDWIPGLPAERLDLLKRTMPQHGAVARPVDYFDTIMPGVWLVTDTRQAVRRDVLGLFNWKSETQEISCSAAKAGLDPARRYYAFDFWSKSPAGSFSGEFKFDVPPQSCRLIAVRPVEEHPVLVSTSRHVTQGIVDVSDETWSAASNSLSGISRVVGNDPYQLRIAGLHNGPKKWELVSATISAADQNAGVRIMPQSDRVDEEGWLRVDLQSNTSRTVSWQLRFTPE
jgi:hypothetical protein